MGSRSRTSETLALAGTLADYWLTDFPRARREVARWTRFAEAIPDDELRSLALATLEEESGLAEGAAIFATLVPRRHRDALVRLLVAWQVAYDFLDTLDEQPGGERDAFVALVAALDPRLAYASLPGDGGYLDRLVARCRASSSELPSMARVRAVSVRAVRRCVEAQERTHAVARDGPDTLRHWALEQPEAEGYLWWELAAGAISSLAVHAVLATAAHPRTTVGVADAVDATYFPSICALSTLLDSAVDTADDAGTTNHRCLAYYEDTAQALDRLDAITGIAERSARALPGGRRHVVILAGRTAFYAAAGGGAQEHVHRQIAAALGMRTAPILWTLRVREEAKRRMVERGPPRALGPLSARPRRRA